MGGLLLINEPYLNLDLLNYSFENEGDSCLIPKQTHFLYFIESWMTY